MPDDENPTSDNAPAGGDAPLQPESPAPGGGGGGIPPQSPPKRDSRSTWLSPGVVFKALVILLSFVLLLVFGDSVFDSERGLADAAYVRGWITLIVCLAAVVLSGFLVYQAFYNQQDSDDRFRRGREIYASFTAILATIVGFYFGSTSDPSKSPILPVPSLKFQAKENVLAIQPNGGKAPFELTITVGEEPPIKRVSDGLHLVTLPKPPAPQSVIKVEVRDSTGQVQHALVQVE